MYSACAAWEHSKYSLSPMSSREVGGRLPADTLGYSPSKLDETGPKTVLSPAWCSKLLLTTAKPASSKIENLLLISVFNPQRPKTRRNHPLSATLRSSEVGETKQDFVIHFTATLIAGRKRNSEKTPRGQFNELILLMKLTCFCIHRGKEKKEKGVQ
ncbi:hypothetical protein TNCV_3336511 [Trichonephila clavipes]|nr:hypothetical protein TNCV_3336511 [Trichonephila clavipes]